MKHIPRHGRREADLVHCAVRARGPAGIVPASSNKGVVSVTVTQQRVS